jgi:Dyp-type peroxidase family
MPKVELENIQALIVRGHGDLLFAQFLLLEVYDREKARTYLRDVRVTYADEPKTSDTALQIAFTRSGLVALGVKDDVIETFAREFNEGMDDDVRARSLGDVPGTWNWGNATKPHVILMLYATRDAHEAFFKATTDAVTAHGFVVKETQDTTAHLCGRREHFGWRDGISTPIVAELGSKDDTDSWTGRFKVGEFVLGYENEYRAYTDSPTVPLGGDPQKVLPLTRDETARDLGKNGTYLVYRQMQQHVARLWSYLVNESRELEPEDDPVDRAIALGAKMVGRWPDGVPLASSMARDGATSDQNDFTYYHRDRDGLRCPLGSHIRRSNPRDDLPSDHGDQNSVEMVRKHQMLRRGRPYGKPLADSMSPRDLIAASRSADADKVSRGLHFICLVGHIGRQFEFVQRGWINSPVFAALFKDADPIIGVHRKTDDERGNASDEFTCPAEPVRRKYKQLPQFTEVIGGAYFFLPGRQALQFIAGMP